MRFLLAFLCFCCVALSACSYRLSGSEQRVRLPNVTVVTDLSQTFDCDARNCLAPYRSFVTDHRQFANPRPEQVVLDELDALDKEELPPVMELSHYKLRTKIIDALNIGFMLDGLNARPLKVTIFSKAERRQDGVRSRRLIFSDPLVGEFEVLQLEPVGSKRVPAIIGLHGHYDSPEIFANQYLGYTLAADGFLVIIPQFRAMGLNIDEESEISTMLLYNGFHLMAIRVYETLLIEKYLRSVNRVDTARIGILGHSGGSSTANLVIHLTEGIAAQVTDHFVEWRDRNFTPSGDGYIHCETVPGLFPLTTTFSEDWSAPIPRLIIPYGENGFEEDASVILNFFATHLHR